MAWSPVFCCVRISSGNFLCTSHPLQSCQEFQQLCSLWWLWLNIKHFLLVKLIPKHFGKTLYTSTRSCWWYIYLTSGLLVIFLISCIPQMVTATPVAAKSGYTYSNSRRKNTHIRLHHSILSTPINLPRIRTSYKIKSNSNMNT